MTHMDRIGVRELRQNASRYLRRVRQGEVIEVTDRGQPVARLVPIPQQTPWERLLAAGQVLAPEVEGDLLVVSARPADPGARPLSEVVSDLRADRS